MKKITLLLLGLLVMTNANADNNQYLPVLTEGKSWEVATIDNDFLSDTTGYYNISVGCDTIVNDLTCKKIEIVPKESGKNQMTAVAYEQDGKVWNVKEDGSMVLLFDIGLHLNDVIDGGCVVEYEDYILMNGIKRKRLIIDSGLDCKCENAFFYIVEGIGVSTDVWIPNLGIAGVGEFCAMLSCSENGETLFTNKDFKMENEYVPLVREGVVWEYVGYRHEDENENVPQTYVLYTLEFSGTTTINGQLYHNIYRTDYDDLGNAKEPYLAAYVREEDKVVTAIDNYDHYYWWDIPEVLYDFNRPMFLPDEAYYEYPNEAPFDYDNPASVSMIQVEVGETLRGGYYIENEYSYYGDSFKTIEGIGVDCYFGDLLVPYRDYCTCENPLAGLSAVYENGELVYKGCKYDQAQQMKHKKEDVNCDGDVTLADVTALYDFLLGNISEAPASYDVNGDGIVTAYDITAIYNIILGIK